MSPRVACEKVDGRSAEQEREGATPNEQSEAKHRCSNERTLILGERGFCREATVLYGGEE
jgi:hypothetical protein